MGRAWLTWGYIRPTTPKGQSLVNRELHPPYYPEGAELG